MIIIQEIEYWKEHKLLPEHYCDFLLALYTKGEEININKKAEQSSLASKLMLSLKVLFLILMIPFSFLVLHFTEFQVYLQLIILILISGAAFLLFVHFKRRDLIYQHLGLLVSLLLLLLLSVQAGSVFFEQSMVLNIIILFNFFFWILISRIYKIGYLMYIGILGVLLVILYIIL